MHTALEYRGLKQAGILDMIISLSGHATKGCKLLNNISIHLWKTLVTFDSWI